MILSRLTSPQCLCLNGEIMSDPVKVDDLDPAEDPAILLKVSDAEHPRLGLCVRLQPLSSGPVLFIPASRAKQLAADLLWVADHVPSNQGVSLTIVDTRRDQEAERG